MESNIEINKQLKKIPALCLSGYPFVLVKTLPLDEKGNKCNNHNRQDGDYNSNCIC